MPVKPQLYLASQSPRRRELLDQIGVAHAVLRVAVPESPASGESAADYVQRLASEKSRAGVTVLNALGLPPLPVLGADTIVVCDDEIMEKPRDESHCSAMLRRLSGRQHQVMTAVAITSATDSKLLVSSTDVYFRSLSDDEITAYWKTGEPCDKAGGYAIQGLGAVFVSELRGSYSGVVGLPIEATIELLQTFGVPWWQPVKE